MDRIGDRVAWRRFALLLVATAAGLAAALFTFVAVLDPYGIRVGPGRPPSPIMDLNQRFMYPQIVRSRRFDAAIFGTSTVRLLDPRQLGSAFGASFANLGLNAGTPWEQAQLASLFLRHVAAPRALVFGLDRTWCEADADRKTLTFRTFPPWLYDEDRLNDYANLFNLTSLEIAGRLALHRLGTVPERIRADGFEVFVPDDATYDLARARHHLHREAAPSAGAAPPVALDEAERARLAFPALAWLDDLLARVPGESRVVLATLPIHVGAQAPPGSLDAAVDAECKERLAIIGRRHGAVVVDFRYPSPVTEEDSHYWDPLHYRIGIAERVAAALADASDGREASDGFYRILVPPAGPAVGGGGRVIRSSR